MCLELLLPSAVELQKRCLPNQGSCLLMPERIGSVFGLEMVVFCLKVGNPQTPKISARY